MIYPVKVDIIPLLENLVSALQPFAQGNFVALRFATVMDKLEIAYHPETILPDLTRLLCRTIAFTPQDYEVCLDVQLAGSILMLQVLNTGPPLDQLRDIVADIRRKVEAKRRKEGGTAFTMRLPLDGEEQEEGGLLPEAARGAPSFYHKLAERLQAYFADIHNLEKAVSSHSKREGIFLQKVNAVILANLGQEHFDATALGRAMALSRSQLYRRLKPLIQIPPAHYIRCVRLQKAKEMLNDTDLVIGEIAFRTGFLNQSHFTRTFREQFGMNPSEARRHPNSKQNSNT